MWAVERKAELLSKIGYSDLTCAEVLSPWRWCVLARQKGGDTRRIGRPGKAEKSDTEFT